MLGLLGAPSGASEPFSILVAANSRRGNLHTPSANPAPHVAALWGVPVWKEFRREPQGEDDLRVEFFVYIFAILLVAKANTGT